MRITLLNKFLLCFVVVFFVCLQTGVAKSGDIVSLREYAENLFDREYKIFSDDSLSKIERINKTKDFINSNFYLDWMAKYALGRNRKGLTQDKINEFSHIYSDFIIETYSELSTSYRGEKSVLKQVLEIDDGLFIVSTEIIRPTSTRRNKVEYLIHRTEHEDTPYLVGDIIAEGISMLNSHQAEFNSVISEEGIDELILHLLERVDSIKAGRKEN